jgi:hypothetical protein
MAFWIDAWWEGRKDRHEEQELLIGLEIEFADLRARLLKWPDWLEDIHTNDLSALNPGLSLPNTFNWLQIPSSGHC